MNNDQILKVLRNERECIARQGTAKCDRDCAKCDLCLPDAEILEVYDFLIYGYELAETEGISEYLIRCKEPINDELLSQIADGLRKPTFIAEVNFEPFSLPEGMSVFYPKEGDTE